MNLLWIVLVGFAAGIVAPAGFLLTTALGIAGAFMVTWIGQSVGWYRPDQGAGFVAASVGAIVVLFIWNRFAARRT